MELAIGAAIMLVGVLIGHAITRASAVPPEERSEARRP
jgi:hypothetical protein